MTSITPPELSHNVTWDFGPLEWNFGPLEWDFGPLEWDFDIAQQAESEPSP